MKLVEVPKRSAVIHVTKPRAGTKCAGETTTTEDDGVRTKAVITWSKCTDDYKR